MIIVIALAMVIVLDYLYHDERLLPDHLNPMDLYRIHTSLANKNDVIVDST